MEANTLQAKDLRIGNVLHYTTAENDVLETTIDWQDLKWISEDPKGFNLAHDPIPLSEEWFLKLGFEKKADWLFVTEKLAIEHITSEKLYGVRLILKPTSVLLRKIKHVHQLQSLFYSITGEELTIKE